MEVGAGAVRRPAGQDLARRGAAVIRAPRSAAPRARVPTIAPLRSAGSRPLCALERERDALARAHTLALMHACMRTPAPPHMNYPKCGMFCEPGLAGFELV